VSVAATQRFRCEVETELLIVIQMQWTPK